MGPEIKKRRQALRLTRKELAELAGTTETTIYRLETGRTPNPTWALVTSIERALKQAARGRKRAA